MALHPRRKKTALHRSQKDATFEEKVCGQKGLPTHSQTGSHRVWRALSLCGTRSLKLCASCFDSKGASVGLRGAQPAGTLPATVEVTTTVNAVFLELQAALSNTACLCGVYMLARCTGDTKVLEINWIKFDP
jgi:hypothetical protein